MKPTWKSHERKVANDFGTNRVPMSGAIGSLNTHSDSFHDHIYLECKYRTHELRPIYTEFDKVKKDAKKNGKCPALIIKQKGSRRQLLLIHDSHIGKDYPADFLTVTIERKVFGVYSLYKDTQQKAEVENKIPCLSLKQKRSIGYLMGFFVADFKTVQQHYGKYNNAVKKS